MKGLLLISGRLLYYDIFVSSNHMRRLKYGILCLAAGVTLSADACTIREFGAENLLYPDQNTLELNFQEVEAFAKNIFSTSPIFTGTEPRFETGLDAPIDLTGFRYAVVHYAPGTSGNPILNQGGSLEFYFVGRRGSCSFMFSPTGPGGNFSNGPITSVTLFVSVPIPDTGGSVVLFAIALGGVLLISIYRAFGRRACGDVSLRRAPVHNKTR